MPDEEFVKLRMWLDAELTMIHIFLAVIIAWVAHSRFITVAVIIYVIYSLLYAATRINYVEKKHKGYTQIPKW